MANGYNEKATCSLLVRYRVDWKTLMEAIQNLV
jgi:hypothetical protein